MAQEEEDREKKPLLIVGTMFCLYRPSAAHTPCSDLLLFEVLWEEKNFVGPHMYAKYGKKQLSKGANMGGFTFRFFLYLQIQHLSHNSFHGMALDILIGRIVSRCTGEVW